MFMSRSLASLEQCDYDPDQKQKVKSTTATGSVIPTAIAVVTSGSALHQLKIDQAIAKICLAVSIPVLSKKASH